MGSAKALAAQAEVQCVVPITHMTGHNHFRLQFKRGFNTLCGHSELCAYIQVNYSYTLTKRNNLK